MNSTQVLEELKTVIDPELHVNIVDLGLIYKVTLDCNCDKVSKSHLHILMTLTTPACPLAPVINQMIYEALRPLFHQDEMEENIFIDLTFDPPWSQEMMSSELQAEFGLDDWYQ